jgi:hypothetical protein
MITAALADELRELVLVGFADPPFERDSEHGDPHLGGQTRVRVSDPAPAQRVGEGRGQRRELDQLTFLQLSVGADDRLALPGEAAALLMKTSSGLEARGRRIDRPE